MSDQSFSRRDLVKIALAVTAAGSIDTVSAQHVHHAVEETKAASGGVYKPQLFTAHEYKTIQRLAELIVPADGVSVSALDAGACEFIDYLSSHSKELAAKFTGGISWLDHAMNERYQAGFAAAKPDQQIAMLDKIAYRKTIAESPELAPGVEFFRWARMLVVDGFYTSKAGIKDVNYQGNGAMAHFSVPQAAIDYALKRSPV